MRNKYRFYDTYIEDISTGKCFNNLKDICNEMNRLSFEEQDSKKAFKDCWFEKRKSIEVMIKMCYEHNLNFDYYLDLIEKRE